MRLLNAFAGFCLLLATAATTTVSAQCPPDTDAPVINNMPADITQTAEPGVCGATISWTIPNATDNCEVTSFSADQVPNDFYSVGITTVTYTAMDAEGNMSAASFNITITDDEDPSLSDMPADISVDNDAGDCTAVVTWDAPTANDNCGIGSLTSTHSSGDAFAVGTTTVTYTLTDVNGNSITDSFDVTVTDNENPTATAQDLTLVLDASGAASTTAAAVDNGSTDNCNIATTTLSQTDFDCTHLGTNTVTLTVTDIYSNQSTATATITVQDNQTPVITQMAGIPANNDANNCSAIVTWTDPAVTDNCTYTLTPDIASGTAFDVGVTTVTYTATDAAGNSGTMSFDVTVVDNEKPVITGTPASFSQSTDADACTAVVTWTEPTATDNCTLQDLDSDHGPGDTFTLGETVVTYTATDIYGNQSTTSFTVTVTDGQNPTVDNTPEDISVNNDTGNCSAVVTWTAPTAGDNCTGASIAQTDGAASGTAFDVGTHIIEYTATDAADNTTTDTFTITVSDNEDPTINDLPADINTGVDAGDCSANVTWTAPTAADNCTVSTLTSSHDPGDTFAVGTTAVTYTATDIHGNVSTSSFNVTVTDDEAPSISGMPSNITQTNDGGDCGAVVSWTEPTAGDNCGVTSFSPSHASGSSFAVGTTMVTYTAMDAAGNTMTSSFTVTVTDDENPSISGMPSNITQTNDAGDCEALVSWSEPTAGDNCGVSTFTSTHNPGDAFAVGTTAVTYMTTDVHGNTTSLSFNITVTDGENPVISDTPADITQTNDAGDCSALVSWTEPTASDNCGVSTFTSSHNPGDSFAVGTTAVTYTATDANDNVTTSTFNITVNDTENPSASGMPEDMTVNNASGTCGVVVSWIEPTASDNCAGATITQTGGGTNGSIFTVGSHTITYTITDAASNSVTDSFTITVNDTENPTVDNTPADISVNNDNGSCGAVVTWTAPTVSDNCTGATIEQTGGDASGSTFAVGTHTIEYTATDAASNTATDSFTITVSDNEAPSISGMPNNITQTNDVGDCGALVSWTEPTAGDNCGVDSFSPSHPNGSSFALGTTTVTYTATDVNGNTTTSTFTVTVTDDEAPVISDTPSDITQANGAGNCSAVVTWTAPTAADNCTMETLTSSHNPGDTFTVGTTAVTYTATDIHGNVSTSSFNVTVTDDENPVISGTQADINRTNDTGSCSAVVTWTALTASDNCEVSTFTSTHNPGDAFTVGTTAVTHTATDVNGNVTTSTFNITVTDDEAPVISDTPADISQNNDAGNCSAVVNWTAPSSTDNCGVATFTSTHNSGDAFAVGTTTVTYTATDINGNVSTSSFDVTVTDAEAPGITGMPSNITQANDAGNCSAVVSWLDGSCLYDDSIDATLSAGASSADATFDGAGSPGTMTISMVWTSGGGSNWPADLAMAITDPSGNCAAIGGYNDTPAGCTSLGNYSTVWPSDWQTTTDGTFSATVDLSASGLTGSGTWAVSLYNGYTSSTGAQFNVSWSIDGLCTGSTDGGGGDGDTPTADDNCTGASIAQTGGDASGSTFNVGTHTITYTATDGAGNTFSDSFTITVTDDENPTITGVPADITQTNDAGDCGALVSWSEPTAGDNCGVTSFSPSHASASSFAVGTTTVTYTAMDDAGNTTTSSFTVTVTDDEAPKITDVPADINLSPDQGECTADATWDDANADDNCSVTNFSSDYNSGDSFNIGTTEVTFTATDAAGNTTMATFNVIVTDNDFDGDGTGDCSDDDIDNDGRDNDEDSDDFDNSVCADTDADGCDDCSQGGEDSFDPANDGPDSDGDGICDDGDNCSDPLANNYLDPANGECENCPNAPIFDSIYYTTAATTLSSADGAIALDISGNAASTLYLTGINGASDYTISLPDDLNDLEAGYYIAQVQDADGCWGVADTSVGGTTLQQPAIQLEVIIPYTLCCSGCGINDIDADGLCDDDDNCTDQQATNFEDSANGPCIIPGCMDSDYVEYNAAATEDDGSCSTLVIEGCTDPAADNYDASANTDDGTCIVPSCDTDVDGDGLCDDEDLCWFTGACNYDNDTYGNVACIVPDAGACETCSGGVVVGDTTPPMVTAVTWPEDITVSGFCGFGTCEAFTAANSAQAGVPSAITWDDDCGVGSNSQSFTDGPRYNVTSDGGAICLAVCEGYTFDRTWTITATDNAGNTATETHVQAITVTLPQ